VELDATRIDFVAFGIGLLIWGLLLAAIWLPQRTKDDSKGLDAYFSWKRNHDIPNATYAEFLASDFAPRPKLDRQSKSIVVSLLALLALFYGMVHWGAVS